MVDLWQRPNHLHRFLRIFEILDALLIKTPWNQGFVELSVGCASEVEGKIESKVECMRAGWCGGASGRG